MTNKEHIKDVLKLLHDQFGWNLSDSLTMTGEKLVVDTINALSIINQQQDKKMYNEEEVLNILYQWSMYKIGIELERLAAELPNILPYNEWFEEFKKEL